MTQIDEIFLLTMHQLKKIFTNLHNHTIEQ
jgi:hypothetical protein